LGGIIGPRKVSGFLGSIPDAGKKVPAKVFGPWSTPVPATQGSGGAPAQETLTHIITRTVEVFQTSAAMVWVLHLINT
jgi:hypothetical protein